MFNWFKSKVELKNNNSIMSSFYNKKGLKLGSEIVVPDNFEGLIFHKGKHYNTLSSGKHKVDKKTFSDLSTHQQNKKFSKKYIKCVCHYVNLSQQSIEIYAKKQKFIVEFEINNSLLFANLMLLYAFKVDKDYTETSVIEVFTELLAYRKYDCSQIKSNDLENYGIAIKSFTLKNKKGSIFNSNESLENSNNTVNILSTPSKELEQPLSESSHQDNSITSQQNSADNNSSPPDTNNMSVSQNTNTNTNQYVCPNCGNISRFSTTFCLKCGYKIQ